MLASIRAKQCQVPTHAIFANIRPAILTELSRYTVFGFEDLRLALFVVEATLRELDDRLGQYPVLASGRARLCEQRTLVVRPKLVPNARRQLRQWQSDVRASSGLSNATLYFSPPQAHCPLQVGMLLMSKVLRL
jgi:hypothetical protein